MDPMWSITAARIDDAWLIKVKIADPAQAESLMDPDTYDSFEAGSQPLDTGFAVSPFNDFSRTFKRNKSTDDIQPAYGRRSR